MRSDLVVMRKSSQSVQLCLPEKSQGGFPAEQSLWLQTPAQHWLKPASYNSRLTGIGPLLTSAWWWALSKAPQSDPELVIIRCCNDNNSLFFPFFRVNQSQWMRCALILNQRKWMTHAATCMKVKCNANVLVLLSSKHDAVTQGIAERLRRC